MNSGHSAVMHSRTTYSSLAEAFQAALDAEGPVNERLAIFAETLRALDPTFAAGVERLIGRLQAVEAGQGAPRVGEPMPAFLLPDENGHLVGLDALLEKGPVAVAFHRGHWCPYCRINARALAAAHATLKDAGGTLVAITPDRAGFAATLKEIAGGDFPILTDLDNGYALSLNLAIWVGEEMRTNMKAFGVDLDTYQGNPAWMLPIPATFVVGRDGLIASRFVDPDYRRRMEVRDLLAAVRAAR